MYKRAMSLSKFPTPQLELNMSPVFTNDPQMTRLFNYLIISRIIKITLSRKLRLILCCYIYILSSCPMSFLNLFLPMVIPPDDDCFNAPVLLQDGPSVSPTPRSHLLPPGAGLIMVTSHTGTGHQQPQYCRQTLEYSWEMKTVQSKEQARVDDSNLNVAETRYKDFPECVCVLEDNISPNNLTDHRGDLRHGSNPGLGLVSVTSCCPLIGWPPGTIPWPLQDHYNPFHSQHPLWPHTRRPPDTGSRKMGSHWN